MLSVDRRANSCLEPEVAITSLAPFSFADLGFEGRAGNTHLDALSRRLGSLQVQPFTKLQPDGSTRVDFLMREAIHPYDVGSVLSGVAAVPQDPAAAIADINSDVGIVSELPKSSLNRDHLRLFGEDRWNRVKSLARAVGDGNEVAYGNRRLSLADISKFFDNNINKESIARFLQSIGESEVVGFSEVSESQRYHLPAQLHRVSPVIRETVPLSTGKTIDETLDELSAVHVPCEALLFVRPASSVTVAFVNRLGQDVKLVGQEVIFDRAINDGVVPVISMNIAPDNSISLCIDKPSPDLETILRDGLYPHLDLLEHFIPSHMMEYYRGGQVNIDRFNPLFGANVATLLDPQLAQQIKAIHVMHMGRTQDDGAAVDKFQQMMALQALSLPALPRPKVEQIYTRAAIFQALAQRVML